MSYHDAPNPSAPTLLNADGSIAGATAEVVHAAQPAVEPVVATVVVPKLSGKTVAERLAALEAWAGEADAEAPEVFDLPGNEADNRAAAASVAESAQSVPGAEQGVSPVPSGLAVQDTLVHGAEMPEPMEGAPDPGEQTVAAVVSDEVPETTAPSIVATSVQTVSVAAEQGCPAIVTADVEASAVVSDLEAAAYAIKAEQTVTPDRSTTELETLEADVGTLIALVERTDAQINRGPVRDDTGPPVSEPLVALTSMLWDHSAGWTPLRADPVLEVEQFKGAWLAHAARFNHVGDRHGVLVSALVLDAVDRVPVGQLFAVHTTRELDGAAVDEAVFVDMDRGVVLAWLDLPEVYLAVR